MAETMKATRWNCDKCGAEGTVRYPANASVYEVLELLREDHAEMCWLCEMDLTRIRVTEVPNGNA